MDNIFGIFHNRLKVVYILKEMTSFFLKMIPSTRDNLPIIRLFSKDVISTKCKFFLIVNRNMKDAIFLFQFFCQGIFLRQIDIFFCFFDKMTKGRIYSCLFWLINRCLKVNFSLSYLIHHKDVDL